MNHRSSTEPAALERRTIDIIPLYYLLAIRQRTRRPAAAPEPVRN